MSNLDRMPPDLLAWLQERVRESDGCWVWQGALFRQREPRAYRDGKVVAVRRYIFNATHQRQMRSNECGVVSCDTPGCVHPNCVKCVTRSSMQKGQKQSKEHSIAIAMARRANAKISGDDVAAIRASDEPIRKIAAQYGIDDTYVSAIRRQKSWKDYASPFAGLLASNESNARRTA